MRDIIRSPYLEIRGNYENKASSKAKGVGAWGGGREVAGGGVVMEGEGRGGHSMGGKNVEEGESGGGRENL